MPLQFRTVQLASARQPGEGLRIGTVRRPPRGVPKSQYRERNLLDVWLPILAPSQALLTAFLKTELSPKSFFRRYRAEMAQTEPRQVIQLLAELAQRTALSIGCFCDDESRCHRAILAELIREAAGEPATRPVTATRARSHKKKRAPANRL